MKKFTVFFKVSATAWVEVEAETEEEAEQMAIEGATPSLCTHCSKNIKIEDVEIY